MDSTFEEILLDLGRLIDENLHPDKHGVCELVDDQGMVVQIEHVKEEDAVIFVSTLGVIPPGRYRELLFVECLRFNGIFGYTGTLAYSEKTSELVYFLLFPVSLAKNMDLQKLLQTFLQIAKIWSEVVQNGSSSFPSLETWSSMKLF